MGIGRPILESTVEWKPGFYRCFVHKPVPPMYHETRAMFLRQERNGHRVDFWCKHDPEKYARVDWEGREADWRREFQHTPQYVVHIRDEKVNPRHTGSYLHQYVAYFGTLAEVEEYLSLYFQPDIAFIKKSNGSGRAYVMRKVQRKKKRIK